MLGTPREEDRLRAVCGSPARFRRLQLGFRPGDQLAEHARRTEEVVLGHGRRLDGRGDPQSLGHLLQGHGVLVNPISSAAFRHPPRTAPFTPPPASTTFAYMVCFSRWVRRMPRARRPRCRSLRGRRPLRRAYGWIVPVPLGLANRFEGRRMARRATTARMTRARNPRGCREQGWSPRPVGSPGSCGLPRRGYRQMGARRPDRRLTSQGAAR